MMDISTLSNKQILTKIGRHCAGYRLAQNLTQGHLAEKAGVGESTVQRFEKGSSCSLDNLIRIMRALGCLNELSSLLAEIGPSPVALARSQQRLKGRTTRKRARPAVPKSPSPRAGKEVSSKSSKAKVSRGFRKHVGKGEDSGWSWGDEQ